MVAKIVTGGLLSAMLLSGCMTTMPPATFAGGRPEMRPERFFAGGTTSSGVLETGSGGPTRRLHVEGRGQALADGSFRLDQTVVLGAAAPKMRTWVMRPIDDHHYVATLTDAVGPVRGEAYGDLFHLTYRMKSPFGGRIEQWMYLQPDGRTVLNEATIKVVGVTVAHLSERITHTIGMAP